MSEFSTEDDVDAEEDWEDEDSPYAPGLVTAIVGSYADDVAGEVAEQVAEVLIEEYDIPVDPEHCVEVHIQVEDMIKVVFRLQCDRCNTYLEGAITESTVRGFHPVGEGTRWVNFPEGERALCSDCMRADLRYQEASPDG